MIRTVIRNGTILSLDASIGDFDNGDILIEDGRIADIGRALEAGDAEVLDATDRIVMPGFVNGHLHTWQTALRGIAGNWSVQEYLHYMHVTIAPRYRPEDIYLGNLLGALNQINNGATTIFDWCHNNPTPEHTDSAIAGLKEAGVRALFGHGTPKPEADQVDATFTRLKHPRGELERLRGGAFASDNGLLTLAMCALGPDFSTWEVTEHDFAVARDLDLIISTHTWGAPGRLNPDGYEKLAARDLLGPRHNLVHGNYLADEELKVIVDTGATVTVTPEIELQMSHGTPLTGRVLALGAAPSIGTDVECNISGDLFTVMRMTLQNQRQIDNKAEAARIKGPVEKLSITPRQVLEWATIVPARHMGLDDRIGSLTRGKQADIIMINTHDLNLFPVNIPVETVVFQANGANVDTVMIAGEIKKRHGRLVYPGIDRKKRELAASGARILEGLELAG